MLWEFCIERMLIVVLCGAFKLLQYQGVPRRVCSLCSQIPQKRYANLRRSRSSRKVEFCDKPNKKRGVEPLFLFGLPERIRTFGLQSRSLTRYPAVPRVGIKLSFLSCDRPSEFAARGLLCGDARQLSAAGDDLLAWQYSAKRNAESDALSGFPRLVA